MERRSADPSLAWSRDPVPMPPYLSHLSGVAPLDKALDFRSSAMPAGNTRERNNVPAFGAAIQPNVGFAQLRTWKARHRFVMPVTDAPSAIYKLRGMHRNAAPAQKPPICPACGREMNFARAVEQGQEGSLNIFECLSCRVTYTTGAGDPGAQVKTCPV
jgi:ribosomal protein L37AE/L43A